jgi:L-ascorbate 6-phosphate lactonase
MYDFANKISAAGIGQTHLFSVGQAGYIIKSSGGQLLGIDLYLSDCVERAEGHIGYKRLLPKILDPGELDFEGIIATHPHPDHFDIDAVPELMGNGNSRTRLFASMGCDKLVKQTQMEYFQDRITYVKADETYRVGDFKISFVNCDHGAGTPDAVGVIVEVDGKRIYEVGDTCLHLEWVNEIKVAGKPDVLILPINGAYGNLNEDEAAELSNELKPRLTIPCHYGMFASHGGDPGKFLNVMTKKYWELPVLLMTQGEHLVIEERL